MEAYNRLLVGNLLVIGGFLVLANRSGRHRSASLAAAVVLLVAGSVVAIDALAQLTIG